MNIRELYGGYPSSEARSHLAKAEAIRLLARAEEAIERMRSLTDARDLWDPAWDFVSDSLRACFADARLVFDGKFPQRGGYTWALASREAK